jgi:CheY-like chemotaxis protein
MDGIEATQAIRNLPGDYFKTVPVIALTANALTGTREIFLSQGFNDYLSKPVELAKLSEILDKWIPDEKRKAVCAAEDSAAEDGATAAEGLPEIDGIDTARGITMTGGSERGYMEVLSLYCTDAEQRLEVLRGAPSPESLDLFITQVHALKSASLSIGAAALSGRAAALEEAGKRGDLAAIGEQIDGFREALTDIVARIREALPSGEDTEEASSIDKKALLQIKAALEEKNIKAADTALDKLLSQPSGGAKAALQAISNSILISEFAAAVKQIDELLDL